MYKILLIIVGFLLIAGCNNSEQDKNENSESVNGIKVKMAFAGNEIYMTLVDNSATRDLVNRLKEDNLVLHFSDYASSEKIAYPDPPLDISDGGGFNPSAGDITIYIPWENIAIFYTDSSGYSRSLMHIGTIDDGKVTLLEEQKSSFSITLSLN